MKKNKKQATRKSLKNPQFHRKQAQIRGKTARLTTMAHDVCFKYSLRVFYHSESLSLCLKLQLV